MSTAFEELAGLLARLRGLFAGLDPHEDALTAAVSGLREWWGLPGLAVYRTAGPESDRARVTCLAAVGSLAHLPLDRAIGTDQLHGAIIGVQGRFLDGLVLPTDSSPEQRDLAGVVGLALDNELQGRATEQSLQERVKELWTLREVQVAIQEDRSLDELVHRIVRILPSGLQFPRAARAELEVDQRRSTAGADGAFADHVEVAVPVGGRTTGRLRLGYVEGGAALIPEERELARAVTEALTTHLERRAAKAALSSSERRRQQVMEAVPFTMFSVDQDRVVEMLAVDEDVPIDDPAGQRFALRRWDDPAAPRLSEAIEQAFAGEGLREEFAWRGGYWDVWLEPVRSAEGEVDGVLGMVADATARRRSRELEARLAALVDSANLAIVGMDIDGIITSWNQGAVHLFGWSAEEAIGRDITLIDTHEPDAVPVRHPEREMRAGRLRDSYVETHRRARDGREIPVGVSLAFIRDADGRDVGLSATYQDLSAQVRATDALAASEQQFRLIADNAQDVIYRLDVRDQPRLEYLNAAAETLLGFPRDRLLRDRRLIVEQTHPEDRQSALGSVVEPEGGTFVSRWQREDGRWIVIEDRRTVLMERGQPVTVIGIARDITDQQEAVERTREELAQERRIAEELRELDEMKTAFLSAVSHELRTPLTSVLGFAETARRYVVQTDPDLVHYLERLLANAKRLQVLMDDLLDVDRLSRSEVTPRLQEVDLADLARRSVRSREAPTHWFHLDLAPVTLPLDQVMIDRVIDNLVRNAGRHTPEGSNVWVRVTPTDDGAHLIVEDDGPGVAPSDRDRIFDPFQQGRGVSMQASPGTGIGLSLVRRFVEAHGGCVHLDERPGGGARFTIELPRTTTATTDGSGDDSDRRRGVDQHPSPPASTG
ncbi:MAG: PAS domain-containing sensor histidine kinase [Nitriliruptor sp.]|nr:MAG: PAS domain-containing sensor histidine kinase [Nitriliruptor sp.]